VLDFDSRFIEGTKNTTVCRPAVIAFEFVVSLWSGVHRVFAVRLLTAARRNRLQ
jgi:hypothetical protein